MKRFLLSIAALLAFGLNANADVEPTYTAVGVVAPAEDWEEDGFNDIFPECEATVEVYGSDSIVIRGFAGVKGYDLGVVTDGKGGVVTTYASGSAVPAGKTGYQEYIYTGVKSLYCWQGYVGDDYSFAYSDPDKMSGYVSICGYQYTTDDSVWGYYNCTWEDGVPAAISTIKVSDKDSNAPIYNVLGQKVNLNYKGIVIQNGKKFIRK